MKLPLRRQIGTGLKALLYALYGRSPGAGVRVLEYHYIDETGSPLSVPPAEFREHLEILRNDGWKALSGDEYLARLADRGSQAGGARREVFITFDDGQESFASVAAPLLAEFGFPATLFVVTDLVGKTAKWFERDGRQIDRFLAAFSFTSQERSALEQHWQSFARARLIDWEGLRSLQSQGFQIESHSASHFFLTNLTESELKQDLQRSRDALRRELGIDSRLLCYPYGDHDEKVIKAAREAGFSAAFASSFSLAMDQSMRIGRLPLGGTGGALQFRFGLSLAMDVLARLRR